MPKITLKFAGPAPPTEREFSLWLRDADPGAALAYHRGCLALDVDAVAPRRSAAARLALLELARQARQAWEQGLVHLVQKRSEPGPFTYLAIKRRPVGAEARPEDEAAR